MGDLSAEPASVAQGAAVGSTTTPPKIAYVHNLGRQMSVFVGKGVDREHILSCAAAFAPLHRGFLRNVGVRGDIVDWIGEEKSARVAEGDVVLVPRGHYSCCAPYGYEMYYLNVMAGLLRKWRFIAHPDHAWISENPPA